MHAAKATKGSESSFGHELNDFILSRSQSRTEIIPETTGLLCRLPPKSEEYSSDTGFRSCDIAAEKKMHGSSSSRAVVKSGTKQSSRYRRTSVALYIAIPS